MRFYDVLTAAQRAGVTQIAAVSRYWPAIGPTFMRMLSVLCDRPERFREEFERLLIERHGGGFVDGLEVVRYSPDYDEYLAGLTRNDFGRVVKTKPLPIAKQNDPPR